MRSLSVVSSLIWSLAFLANAGLTFVAIKYGDEPLDWFVIPLLVVAPLVAAVMSIVLPFRLRSKGHAKMALRTAQLLFLISVGGLCFEAYLFQSR